MKTCAMNAKSRQNDVCRIIVTLLPMTTGTPEREAGGKRPSILILRRARGQEGPFNGAIHFFNNVYIDIMTTMNLTYKLNNHPNLHWSCPDMQKRTSFTSVRILLKAS